MSRGALRGLALVAWMAGCGRCGAESSDRHDAAIVTVAPPAPLAEAGAPEPPRASLDAGPKERVSRTDEDAGPSSCRRIFGPAEQPFRGPAALALLHDELALVVNEGGRPRKYVVPVTPPPPSSAVATAPPSPTSFVAVRWPPCEVAGKWVYCQGQGGVVNRASLEAVSTSPLGPSEVKSILKSRPGTRIAAAPLGKDHAVVAVLDVRRTTEGDMIQAFVALDENEPVRLSDEGAGATVVRLAPRGPNVTAVYLDARSAMSPLHARTLSLRDRELALGNDAVIFVGGPPERGIDVVLAGAGGEFFALVPMPKETVDFGMAAIRVHDPPKDDVGAAWSLYPNGLDPAPIAATVESADGAISWVLRVRPKSREPGAPRVLELGRVDALGGWSSSGVVVDGKPITDVAMAVDRHGAIWMLYGDTTSTWLERRLCQNR